MTRRSRRLRAVARLRKHEEYARAVAVSAAAARLAEGGRAYAAAVDAREEAVAALAGLLQAAPFDLPAVHLGQRLLAGREQREAILDVAKTELASLVARRRGELTAARSARRAVEELTERARVEEETQRAAAAAKAIDDIAGAVRARTA